MTSPLLSDLARLSNQPDLDWGRVLVMRSVGHVRATAVEPDVKASRGMHLLILDKHGHPSTYFKCRPPGMSGEKEAALLRLLRDHPTTSAHVPQSQEASVEGVHLIAMDFVRGEPLGKTYGPKASKDLASSIDRTLSIVEAFAQVYQGAPLPANPLRLPELTDTIVTQLQAAGLTVARVDAIRRRCADCGPLPAYPQHGDLAPLNILVDGDRTVIIDLELFGQVQVPLFDAWGLARSLHWLTDSDRPNTPWWKGEAAEPARVRGARMGLDEGSIGTTLIWYVVWTIHLLVRRGNPPERHKPLVQALNTLLDELG